MLRRQMGALAFVLLAALAPAALAQTGDRQAAAKEAETYYNKGLELAGKHKLEEAAEAFDRAVKLRPDYAEAHNELGKAYDALGRHEKARAAYQEAARLKPELAQTQTHGTAGYDDTTRQREIQAERDRATGAVPSQGEVAGFDAPPSFWGSRLFMASAVGLLLLAAAALYFLRRRGQPNT